MHWHKYHSAAMLLSNHIVSSIVLIGIYVMMAAGIWFHEIENLTTDEGKFNYNKHHCE
jgi:hypothetical protein